MTKEMIGLLLAGLTLALLRRGRHSESLATYVLILLVGPGMLPYEDVGHIFFSTVVFPLGLYASVRRANVEAALDWFDRLVLALVLYLAATTVWSPYPGEGLKAAVYMGGGFILMYSLRRLFLAGRISMQPIAASALLAVGLLAMMPSIGADDQNRLGGYGGGQSLAQLLAAVSLLALLEASIGHRRNRLGRNVLRVAGLVIGLAIPFTGSRLGVITWLVGVVFLASSSWSARGRQLGLSLFPAAFGVLVAVPLAVVFSRTLGGLSPRVGQLVLATDSSEILEIGTLAWRLQMYSATLIEWSGSGDVLKMFGHGLGSGYLVLARHFTLYDVANADWNRIIHNEGLRLLYEGGIIAALLLLAVVISLLRGIFATRRRPRGPVIRATVVMAPLVVGALATQNVFSSTPTVAGLGMALAMAALSSVASADGSSYRRLRSRGARPMPGWVEYRTSSGHPLPAVH